MTLYRREGESQRTMVERALVRDGSVSAYDALYDMEWEDGRKASITRLAAIVHELRSEGWQISEHAGPGRLAVYTLGTFAGHPVGRVRECPACRMTHAVGTTCAWREQQPAAVAAMAAQR